jgi:phosphinothricin acetyltransferase
MNIRKAKINDLPSVVEIYNSTIAGRMVTADVEPVTIEERMEWFFAHDNDKRPLFVVIENDEIVAWLSFSDFHERAAYNITSEISIYIKEQYRNQGLGEKILKWALDFAKEVEIENIVALIFGHNIPSIKLFEKFNFQKWAHLPGVAKLDGVLRDLVILGYKIK